MSTPPTTRWLRPPPGARTVSRTRRRPDWRLSTVSSPYLSGHGRSQEAFSARFECGRTFSYSLWFVAAVANRIVDRHAAAHGSGARPRRVLSGWSGPPWRRSDTGALPHFLLVKGEDHRQSGRSVGAEADPAESRGRGLAGATLHAPGTRQSRRSRRVDHPAGVVCARSRSARDSVRAGHDLSQRPARRWQLIRTRGCEPPPISSTS